MNRLWYGWLFFGGLLGACQPEKQYGRLIGEWEVIRIEARAERVNLDEIPDFRLFHFTNQGDFYQREKEVGVSGKWRIRDDRLQLILPEIIDLNGRLVSPSLHYEWELTLSSAWMIWRGTAPHQTQHLKILFRKIPSPGDEPLTSQ